MKIKIEKKTGNETATWQWVTMDSDDLVRKIRELAYDAGAEGTEKPEEQEAGYEGFLLIRCEHCGKVKEFHISKKIKEHRCSCGKETPLEGLVKAKFQCPECTRSWVYWTNITEEHIQCDCVADHHEMKAAWSDEEDMFLPED